MFLSSCSTLNKLNKNVFINTSKWLIPKIIRTNDDFSVQKRYIWKKKTALEKERSFFLKDQMCNEQEYLIYQSDMVPFLPWAQGIMNLTTLVGLGAIFTDDFFVIKKPILEEDQMISSSHIQFYEEPYQLYSAMAFFVLANLYIYRSLSCLPLRVYYNQKHNSYTLILPTMFFWQSKKVLCRSGDIEELQNSAYSIIMGRYRLNGKHLYFFERFFRRPDLFNGLLGYKNKPLEDD